MPALRPKECRSLPGRIKNNEPVTRRRYISILPTMPMPPQGMGQHSSETRGVIPSGRSIYPCKVYQASMKQLVNASKELLAKELLAFDPLNFLQI